MTYVKQRMSTPPPTPILLVRRRRYHRRLFHVHPPAAILGMGLLLSSGLPERQRSVRRRTLGFEGAPELPRLQAVLLPVRRAPGEPKK